MCPVITGSAVNSATSLRRFFIMVMSQDCRVGRIARGRRMRFLAGFFRFAHAASNVVVIGLVGWSRRIAHNGAKSAILLSTLIEACASNGRGLAISNEEQSDV